MKKITKTEDCIKCRDCCRFTKDNEYSPIFTREELKVLDENQIKRRKYRIYKKSKGLVQIVVTKSNTSKDGYICPFLNEKTDFCEVYRFQPFYCAFWPFRVARSKNGKDIELVCFKKEECPSMAKRSQKEIEEYSKYAIKLIKSERFIEFYKKYPELIFKHDKKTFKICNLNDWFKEK